MTEEYIKEHKTIYGYDPREVLEEGILDRLKAKSAKVGSNLRNAKNITKGVAKDIAGGIKGNRGMNNTKDAFDKVESPELAKVNSYINSVSNKFNKRFTRMMKEIDKDLSKIYPDKTERDEVLGLAKEEITNQFMSNFG